jgi:hypothetical protein
MDVEQGAAIAIVRMVMAALTLALDTPDISLEDRTASCLVAERVMCATVVAIVQKRPSLAND